MDSETFDYRKNKGGNKKGKGDFPPISDTDLPEFDVDEDLNPGKSQDTLYGGGGDSLEMDYGRRRSGWNTIIAIIIGFVIGFGSAWLLINRPPVAPDDVDGVGGVEENGGEVDGSVTGGSLNGITEDPTVSQYEVLVKDQGAGTEVFISRVALKRGGWVVIHEDLDGAPGNILGAQLFDAGDHPGGAVTLLRGTVPGSSYYAMLHSDDGDRQFDFSNDLPVTDESGEVVIMKFEAYAN